MITKGIIKGIDLLGNTCTVHIPFFETAGNDPIIETATVSNTPGSYNGYKVGDAVYVAFEDGNMSTPVIIGKLYLGTEKEKADPRGVSNVEESAASKKATLPADAKLAAEIDSTVPNTTVPYSSLSSIANGLNKLNTDVGQMDRDYGNRFKQVISNAEGLKSEIEQTAENINASVVHKREDGSASGFGWDLNNSSWTIKAHDQNGEGSLPKDGLDIFKITSNSVEINTPRVKLAGYPRVTTVRYAYGETDTYPNLYKEGYDKSVDEAAINTSADGENGWTVTELSYKADSVLWQWTQTAKYEYKDTNETWAEAIDDKVVKLAINENLATVNNNIANTLAIAQGKTTNYYSSTDPANDPSNAIKEGDCWFQTISSGTDYNSETGGAQGKLYQWNGSEWEDIGGELVANKLTANYINALDITAKKIEILDGSKKPLFKADGISDTHTVQIAGFTVTSNSITSGNKVDSNLEQGSTKPGVYIGSDGISIGTGFTVKAGGAVSLSDAVKNDLRGYSIAASVSRPSFTEADWNTYGEVGHLEYWNNTSDLTATCRIGDIFTVVGTATDTGNSHVLYYKRIANDTRPDLYGTCMSHSIANKGDTGRAVLSTTKYYTLAKSTPSAPSSNPPTAWSTSTKTGWSTSPPAFISGYNYYESVRTVYNTTVNGKNYEWSTPVENSMLTVDFINSLGITAKKIDIANGNNVIFSADSLSDTPSVQIGSWAVTDSGLASTDILLAPGYLQIGESNLSAKKLKKNDNSEDDINQLYINGGDGRSGFLIGGGYDIPDTNGQTFTTITATVKKESQKWKLVVSTNEGLQSSKILTIFTRGDISSYEVDLTHTVTLTTKTSAQSQTITLPYDSSTSCYVAWWKTQLANKNTTITEKVAQYNTETWFGLNRSLASIVPYYKELSLGNDSTPWSNLYSTDGTIWETLTVKNIVAETISANNITANGIKYKMLSETSDTTNNSVSNSTTGGCFDAGTQVLLADGSTKNIEDVQIGELVQSYNTKMKCFETSKVLATRKLNISKNLVLLTFEDGTQLYTTTTHPFYTTTGWVSLNPNYDYSQYEDIEEDYFELMTVGQYFYRINSKVDHLELLKLTRIQYRQCVSLDHFVYNLDVDNANTFFTNGILGHNKGDFNVINPGGVSKDKVNTHV